MRFWLAACVSVSVAMAGTTPLLAAANETTNRHPRLSTHTKRRWGVEVVGVTRMAAGYMLQFRYRVIDSDKAAPLFERASKPVLTDEATGAELIVPTPPKTGPLRSSNEPIAGRTYWMAFANPAKFVKQGSRVTVTIGDFRARGLVVE